LTRSTAPSPVFEDGVKERGSGLTVGELCFLMNKMKLPVHPAKTGQAQRSFRIQQVLAGPFSSFQEMEPFVQVEE
jgi:hypothetical protein